MSLFQKNPFSDDQYFLMDKKANNINADKDTEGDNGSAVLQKKIKLRPMLCMATFPSSVQQGNSVSADAVAKMDEDGFALSLGSYDCRFSSSQEERKQTNSKKEGEGGGTNRSKSNGSMLLRT
mmetsp:Transcript_17176/g.24413  ORF Transcript_17176/g.24413 Transcript_17176/m.24413 type:complete len:123 (-) Transcript_17176:1835-2203(-)